MTQTGGEREHEAAPRNARQMTYRRASFMLLFEGVRRKKKDHMTEIQPFLEPMVG